MEIYDQQRPLKKLEVRKANFSDLSYYRKKVDYKSNVFDKLLIKNING